MAGKFKKSLSLLLAVCLAVAVIPITASAASMVVPTITTSANKVKVNDSIEVTISLEGIWENTLLENSYRGKAKVNHADGDKFVEDIGKEFARGKALEKYHRAFDRKSLAMLLDARVLVATIEHYCAKKSINTEKIPSIEAISKKRFGCK